MTNEIKEGLEVCSRRTHAVERDRRREGQTVVGGILA